MTWTVSPGTEKEHPAEIDYGLPFCNLALAQMPKNNWEGHHKTDCRSNDLRSLLRLNLARKAMSPRRYASLAGAFFVALLAVGSSASGAPQRMRRPAHRQAPVALRDCSPSMTLFALNSRYRDWKDKGQSVLASSATFDQSQAALRNVHAVWIRGTT